MKYLAAPMLALMLLVSPAAIQAQSPEPTAEKVTLTAAQTTKINQIRQDTRRQIQALLTTEQRETYTNLRQQGVVAPQAIEMVNLTQTKRDQLGRILATARNQIIQVLSQP